MTAPAHPDFKSEDRRAVAWLTLLLAGGFFAQGQVITVHEDQVIRLVGNNSPPGSLLFVTFFLIACGCVFLVWPALRCYLVPGRKTNWSAFRPPLAILASGLWATLPLTWATEGIPDETKAFTTKQTVLKWEARPKGGSGLIVTSWRGLRSERLHTTGTKLDSFLPGEVVEIRLVNNKAGTLNVTHVVRAKHPK